MLASLWQSEPDQIYEPTILLYIKHAPPMLQSAPLEMGSLAQFCVVPFGNVELSKLQCQGIIKHSHAYTHKSNHLIT